MPNTSAKYYQIAYESFASIAMDQPIADRMSYRSIAMEAMNGPDAGMVIDRLYQSVASRAGINFGKIPESNGDLTKFAKYRTLHETLSLLNRQIGDQNIKELKLAYDLHDCLIKCREDFVYGFKTDSQFLKMTYNTMVFSLCELLNLCSTIYIDSLKASAEGKPFQPEDFSNLLLVQNIKKFVTLVQSGEWSTMITTIRKNASNLAGLNINFTLLGKAASATATAAGNAAGTAAGVAATVGAGATSGAAGFLLTKPPKIIGVPAKIVLVLGIIIGTLLVVRGAALCYYKGVYKLDDMLTDMEKLLHAHMEMKADTSGTYKGLEFQKKLYNHLSGLQDHIRTKILKVDVEGRKELKKSNAEDLKKESFTPPEPNSVTGADDDFAIM